MLDFDRFEIIFEASAPVAPTVTEAAIVAAAEQKAAAPVVAPAPTPAVAPETPSNSPVVEQKAVTPSEDKPKGKGRPPGAKNKPKAEVPESADTASPEKPEEKADAEVTMPPALEAVDLGELDLEKAENMPELVLFDRREKPHRDLFGAVVTRKLGSTAWVKDAARIEWGKRFLESVHLKEAVVSKDLSCLTPAFIAKIEAELA
jgi:hypothetical protein